MHDSKIERTSIKITKEAQEGQEIQVEIKKSIEENTKDNELKPLDYNLDTNKTK